MSSIIDKFTERQIQKELNRQAVMFEEACNRGFRASAIKFQELAEEWFENYAKNSLRSTTYERMLQLTHRIYPAIGHLRIDKINARQLQGFVNSLAKEGANEKTGKPLAHAIVWQCSRASELCAQTAKQHAGWEEKVYDFRQSTTSIGAAAPHGRG